MENHILMGYTMWHETSRNRPATGAATPTGHPVAKGGQESVGCGARSERVREFGVPVGSDVPEKRDPGSSAPSHAGPSAQAFPVTEEATGDVAPERPPGRRISDGSVDLKACRRDDSTALGHGLSPLPRLETPGKPGVELSKTGASGPPTRRSRHRPLEAVSLAP